MFERQKNITSKAIAEFLIQNTNKMMARAGANKHKREKKRDKIAIDNPPPVVNEEKLPFEEALILNIKKMNQEILDQRKEEAKNREVSIEELKFRDIFNMPTETEKDKSDRFFKNFEKSDQEIMFEELMEDEIEYGQNIQDLDKFTKKAYISDSEEEHPEVNQNDVLPSLNVYHDIGPYSRELIKIKNEKALRKAISKTYMRNYWNKQETKELTEDVLIGYIGNKIPVTPLLFTLQLNSDRYTRIKEEIDYSVTSESDADNSEEDEHIDQDTLIVPPFDNTMESKQSSKDIRAGTFQVKKAGSFSKNKNLTQNVNTKSSENIQPRNFIIKEEVNCSGDEVNISIKG